MPQNRFEFVVEAPPCTANNDNSKRKTEWKQAVGVAAYRQWIAEGRSRDALPITAAMEVYVTTYCRDVLYDVDNVLKWTLDGLNASEPPLLSNRNQREIADTYKCIYKDDALIYKITSERVAFGTWTQLTSNNISELVYGAIRRYMEPDKQKDFMHIVLVWAESETY